MPSRPDIDRAIADLYDTLVGNAGTASLPQTLARLGRAQALTVWNLDAASGAIADLLVTSHPPECISQYESIFCRLDPWAAHQLRAGSGDVVIGGEIVDERGFARSAFYNEFGRHFGLFHAIGAVIPVGGGVCAAMSMVRPRSADPFGEAEREIMQHFVPHLQRGFQMRARLLAGQGRAWAAEAGLDALATAAIVADGGGHVLFANPAAVQLDRQQAGLSLGRTGAPIAAVCGAQSARLRELIANAARGGTGGAIALASRSGAVLLCLVSPAPRTLAAQHRLAGGCALVTLRPATPRPNLVTLERRAMESFAMTKAEAAVAALLASGVAPSGIATRRHVQLSTVRTLLRRALARCGATNLRDMTRLLASFD